MTETHLEWNMSRQFEKNIGEDINRINFVIYVLRGWYAFD